MAYSALTDLQDAVEASLLIQLTDDESLGVVNTTRIDRAIANADSVIDGHVRAHYSVPLSSPIPSLIRKISVDLALHELYSRRAAHFELPQFISDKHKAAMDMLKAMRDGKMDLGIEPTAAASSAEVAEYSGNDPLFTSSTLEDF